MAKDCVPCGAKSNAAREAEVRRNAEARQKAFDRQGQPRQTIRTLKKAGRGVPLRRTT